MSKDTSSLGKIETVTIDQFAVNEFMIDLGFTWNETPQLWIRTYALQLNQTQAVDLMEAFRGSHIIDIRKLLGSKLSSKDGK